MKDFIKLAGTLCAITFIAAALLAATNFLTEERIALAAEEKQNTAMRTLLPDAEDFIALKDGIWRAENEGGTVGYCVNSVTKGYGGDIELLVGISADGSLAGIEVLSTSETAGLGANCTKDDFKAQFGGQEYPISVVKGGGGDGQISALTGATITSNAVAKGVNQAFEELVAAFDEIGG